MTKTYKPKRRGMGRKRNTRKKTTTTKAIVSAIKSGNGVTYLNKNIKTYRFTRSDIDYGFINPSPSSATLGGILTFRLGSVPGYSEFTSLFQKYRINKVKLTFNMYASPAQGSPYPTLYICKNLEPTNTTSLPTVASMEQQSGVSMFQFSDEHRVFTKSVYPYIATRTLTSASAASDVVEFTDRRRSMWIDCNDVSAGAGTGTVHHGFRWLLDAHGTFPVDEYAIQITAEYSLEFKGID